MVHIHADNITIEYPVMGRYRRPTKSAGSDELRRGDVVSKGRKNVIRAVEDFSVRLEAGDRVGIIGLNGSGKSTLLRVFAGIYEPSSGELDVVGNISSLLNVGLGTRMESTGRRNIYLRGYMRGLSKEEIQEIEPKIIEFSGLGEFIDMPLRTYSSGMNLRLSFAIATSFSPEILLLDEWIGVGDQQFQEKARLRLKGLLEESGITVLCSHNVNIVDSVCTRVIWLDEGKVVSEGMTYDVLPRYEEWRRTLKVSEQKAAELVAETKG
ncbi:MAG: sugar ABC transporter ATP-binding protein [Ponticaulis sp.]|nr:sugar ABC transporter ATP-binding protein [Ponticaulis sp.]|tara:strand:- start:5299 stop:6099 length:801 start_codon:yes stop_codon:yes gene_type:complete